MSDLTQEQLDLVRAAGHGPALCTKYARELWVAANVLSIVNGMSAILLDDATDALKSFNDGIENDGDIDLEAILGKLKDGSAASKMAHSTAVGGDVILDLLARACSMPGVESFLEDHFTAIAGEVGKDVDTFCASIDLTVGAGAQAS